MIYQVTRQELAFIDCTYDIAAASPQEAIAIFRAGKGVVLVHREIKNTVSTAGILSVRDDRGTECEWK